jgi:predicted DNA-binding protein
MSKTHNRPMTIRIAPDQYERLRAESDRTGLSVQDIVRLCIALSIDSWHAALAPTQEVAQ